jgi:hypothetical protein
MTALAVLYGAVVGGGVWLTAVSVRKAPVRPGRWRRSWRRRAAMLGGSRMALAAGAGVAVLVVTRWPVAAVGAAAGSWFTAGSVRPAGRGTGEARAEAIALWTEMLRDSMGTARGVEGVLMATAPAAPLAIRPEVQKMAARLAHEPIGDVLDDLAADLDHPLGDLVVTALRLTATSGGRRVREVLADLATAAYGEAESLRRIAVARQRPRAALRYTALAIAGFIALLVVFSHAYLAPYGSPLGQVVLAVVAGYWAAGFWWMHRMGRIAPAQRFVRRGPEP